MLFFTPKGDDNNKRGQATFSLEKLEPVPNFFNLKAQNARNWLKIGACPQFLQYDIEPKFSDRILT